jgi:hypothetical protein
MTDAQILGLIVGAFVGWIIAAAITAGKYRYLGGPYFEQTKPPMGCAGCLIQIILAGIGAAVGAAVGFVLTKR